MAVNLAYAGTAPGFFKILHIVFGAIAIGCGGHAYESEYFLERMFLWSTVTCFVISIIYLLVHLASDRLPQSNVNRGIDILYHALAGILLIAGGSLMIVSSKNYDRKHCSNNPWDTPCQERRAEKLAGGSFSIINGIIYLITVGMIAVVRQEDPDTAAWETRIKGYQSPSARDRSNANASPEVRE